MFVPMVHAQNRSSIYTPPQFEKLELWLRSDNVIMSGTDIQTFTDASGNSRDFDHFDGAGYATLNNIYGEDRAEVTKGDRYDNSGTTISLTDSSFEVVYVGGYGTPLGQLPTFFVIPLPRIALVAPDLPGEYYDNWGYSTVENNDVKGVLSEEILTPGATNVLNFQESNLYRNNIEASPYEKNTSISSPFNFDTLTSGQEVSDNYVVFFLEVLVFSTKLTSVERTNLSNYLNKKYGIY